MLTEENDVEIHALAARGWSQSAISRHTGRDRKTVRKYLAAGGVSSRERAASCLEPFRGYIAARFVDDPHLPAVTLHDELTAAWVRPLVSDVGQGAAPHRAAAGVHGLPAAARECSDDGDRPSAW